MMLFAVDNDTREAEKGAHTMHIYQDMRNFAKFVWRGGVPEALFSSGSYTFGRSKMLVYTSIER